MSDKLQNEVALVTGGGRGIGRAIAIALADAGASVAVVARSRDEIDRTAAEIKIAGRKAMAIEADVRIASDVRHSVTAAESALGPVSILVNNAGAPGPAGNDWSVDADQWWDCLEGIVRGAFLYNQAVVPGMIARGQGRVIHVASTTGTRAIPRMTATSVAKTALIRLSEGLAAAAGPQGIASFAIHPGIVKTDLLLSYGLELPESMYVSAERAGELCVKLASGSFDGLSGRFLTIDDDLEGLLARAGEIASQDTHTLRLKGLD